MPEAVKSALVANNTVKLNVALRERVAKAMVAEGFTVWSEFCRVALMEKCHLVEERLRARDPAEFQRLFGGQKESTRKNKSP